MKEMIKSMVQEMVAQSIKEVISEMMGTTPQVAPASAVDSVAVKPEVPTYGRKLTLADFDDDEVVVADTGKAELGAWEALTKDGRRYVWYGWADPNTGKPVFPGKQLFHVNDFYLKRDYGAYHPGKTTRYKFKDGGARAFVSSYKVRTEVDAKDATAFIKFMQDKEAAKAAKVHDTPDTYANWCNHNK